MGRTLDAALVDFNARYSRGARWQRRMTFDKTGARRPPVFLHRCLRHSARRVKRIPRLRCHAAVKPELQHKYKIAMLVLFVTDGTSQALLEITHAPQPSLEHVFKSIHLCQTLLKHGLNLGIRVTLAALAYESRSSPTVPPLTEESCHRLIVKDKSEWDLRKLPKPHHTQISAVFTLRIPTIKKQILKLELGSEKGESNMIACTLNMELFKEEIVIKKTTRLGVLKGSSSSSVVSILDSNLAMRCDDVEFAFPFGPNLCFERVQRANGRCIFCMRGIGGPKEMLLHLHFDHNFPNWHFDFEVTCGLLRVHVQSNLKNTCKNLTLQSGSTNNLTIVPVPRLYVHSETCEPLLPHEVDRDSEADVDESWIHERAEGLLDEFEDVAEEEVEVLKLWNRHIRFHAKSGPILDLKFPLICKAFVQDNCDKLRHLKQQVITHLLHLWDLGLIDRQMIQECSTYLN